MLNPVLLLNSQSYPWVTSVAEVAASMAGGLLLLALALGIG